MTVGRVCRKSSASLAAAIEPSHRRPLPSYSTFRRVLRGVEFQELTEQFNCWARTYVDIEM